MNVRASVTRMGASDDEDRRDVLRALQQLARGERRTEGRDEQPGAVTIRVGGGDSRALDLEISSIENMADGRRIALRVGEGEISIVFSVRGEWIFSHGDLRLDAPDRTRGGAFVAALARWLGTPLAEATNGTPSPTLPVDGSYVKLGVLRDADGIDWDRLKLFFGRSDHDHSEVFLSVAADGGQARLSEKWSRYRRPLLRLFDDAIGQRRELADRKEVVVGEGGARLSVPSDWLVTPREGHMRVTDARDDCCLEVSTISVPRFAPGLPSLAERLSMVLVDGDHGDSVARIASRERGDMDLVWAEYDYGSDDPVRGVLRPARERILLAANDRLQVLATFSYWIDDEPWAVPDWERIVDTLEFAGGGLAPDIGGKVRPPGD